MNMKTFRKDTMQSYSRVLFVIFFFFFNGRLGERNCSKIQASDFSGGLDIQRLSASCLW